MPAQKSTGRNTATCNPQPVANPSPTIPGGHVIFNNDPINCACSGDPMVDAARSSQPNGMCGWVVGADGATGPGVNYLNLARGLRSVAYAQATGLTPAEINRTFSPEKVPVSGNDPAELAILIPQLLSAGYNVAEAPITTQITTPSTVCDPSGPHICNDTPNPPPSVDCSLAPQTIIGAWTRAEWDTYEICIRGTVGHQIGRLTFPDWHY